VRDGLVLLWFMLLALGIMHPVLQDPQARIIGWYGDNVQHTYITGWMGQALLLGESPFVDPRLNYPDDLVITLTDVPYISTLLAAPATWLLGPVFSYNLIIWVCMWLSGYTAYLWLLHLTGSRVGAIIAGMAFLLTPYRTVRSYGHLNMVATYPLPLFFWALDNALQPAQPHWRHLLLLAGATFLVGGNSQYYLMICLLTGSAYALMMLWPRYSYLLNYSCRYMMIVGAGALVSALPYLLSLSDRTYVPYDIMETRSWSVDPVNFILPFTLHPLWGDLVAQLRPEPLWVAKTLYVGIVALVLAVVALAWRGKHERRRWVWLGTALLAFVFALGTDLHINNQPVQPEDPFWLPSYYLGQMPFFSLMRAWSRFGIITILFVALLAGLGATYLVQRFPRWRWQVGAVLCAMLLIDMLPGRVETSPLEPRPVDRWLAEQPDVFAVAHLPNDYVVNYYAMFGSLFHAQHVTAYNHPQHVPPAYLDFAERASDFPAPHSIEALRELELRYLLLERVGFNGQTAPAWEDIQAQVRQSPDLEIVTELDGVLVVAFREEPPPAVPEDATR
jgi:hypothetical protein